MPNNRPRAGFKLWQTVPIVAALAVIGWLLFAVFQPVRENSYNPRSHCASNLKQLGLGFIQYAQDADEQTPPGVNAAGNGWAGQIYPFVKSTGVYQCPSDQQDGHYVSYAENRNTVKQPQANFVAPAQTVQLYETTTPHCDPSTAETVSATGLSAPQNSARHSDQDFGLNFLAEDGHVKYLKPGAISSEPNAARPNQDGPFALTFAAK